MGHHVYKVFVWAADYMSYSMIVDTSTVPPSGKTAVHNRSSHPGFGSDLCCVSFCFGVRYL